MISGREALERLRQGNRRFVSDTPDDNPRTNRSRRAALVADQHPFAVILGCSDSRVPPEIVFDQGLGDLFVVRVAGSIAEPSQVGSVEFAATQFGARLVVVLGHSRCGAVLATLDAIERSANGPTPGLRSILEAIRPSVQASIDSEPTGDRDAVVRRAVRSNIEVSMGRLRQSEILAPLIRDEGLVVAGAEYSLETGTVEFFD